MRGSTFECVAILDYLKDTNALGSSSFRQFYSRLEEISKMLFAMIKKLS
ncbi:MAG: four helix bundle protein [Fluviicola sp.]|nr:four helix bundle protein [Fluviicola sp.]